MGGGGGKGGGGSNRPQIDPAEEARQAQYEADLKKREDELRKQEQEAAEKAKKRERAIADSGRGSTILAGEDEKTKKTLLGF